MKLFEKRVDRKEVFEGQIFSVYLDQAQIGDGSIRPREVVEHSGGVCVVAVDDDRNVYMVRQFRYAYDRVILEIPAGKLEYGEDPLSAAKRELEEEIGVRAESWISLGDVWPTPGFCDEVQHLYLARGLIFGETHPDEDEFLEQVQMPFAQAFAMAADGRMQDSKSVVAILRAHLLMEEERDG